MVLNFATSKNLSVQSTMFPHRNVHEFTWSSPDEKTHDQTDNILIDRRRYSSILDIGSFRAADCDTDHYPVVARIRESLVVSDFKNAYNLLKSELLYNILIEFWVSMKQVRLIKMCLNETYNTARLGKHLLDNLPIQNDLKQGEALSSLLYKFALG
jgi:hypothetical protein